MCLCVCIGGGVVDVFVCVYRSGCGGCLCVCI